MKKYTCERCCKPLDQTEIVTCNACHIATLESLLASKAWMKVRGPYMAKEIRAELKMLKITNP